MVKVGKSLFPLFALALELPETYFADKVGLTPCTHLCHSSELLKWFQTRNSAAIMRALHYPLQDEYPEIDDSTIGIGAHSECLVFLTPFPPLLILL